MSFFFKYPTISGLERSPSSIKSALLRKKGKKVEIVELKEHSLNEETLFEPSTLVVSALSNREVLLKPFELPLKKKREIEQALGFQVESLFTYPIEKMVIQSITIQERKHQSLLSVFAIKKEHLEKHLHQYREQGIEPEIVTTESLALAALSDYFQPSSPCLFIHLNDKEGLLILAENGKLLSARSFDKDKYEIQKSIDAMLASNKEYSFDSIFLISEKGEAQGKHDLAMISQVTKKSIQLVKSPFPTVSDEDFYKFSLPLGVGLSAVKNTHLNFRCKEYRYPHPWKRLKKPLLLYTLLASSLFFSCLLLEKKLLSQKETALFQAASPLILKTPLTQEELLSACEQVEEQERAKIETFALLPQIPKVSDVLAWLSSHPQLLSSTGEPLVQIEEFRYIMESRPEFSKREARYLVKVVVTFATSSSSVADCFHQALISPNTFVDAKKEIEWTAENGKYQVTFYLKDKTRYV